jgi:predicted nucleic acid-binding protein
MANISGPIAARIGWAGAASAAVRLTMPSVKVVLDTNCLIDLAERRETAAPLSRIVAASREGQLEITVAAITASENPRKGSPSKTWAEFTDLLARAGIAAAEIKLARVNAKVDLAERTLLDALGLPPREDERKHDGPLEPRSPVYYLPILETEADRLEAEALKRGLVCWGTVSPGGR